MPWVDTFTRADGPIGNGWTDIAGGAIIDGNTPTGPGTPFIIRKQDTVAVPTRKVATITIDDNAQVGDIASVIVCSDAAGQNYYRGVITMNAGDANCRIIKCTAGVEATIIGPLGIPFAKPSAPFTFSIQQFGIGVDVWVNGSEKLNVGDDTFKNNEYVGMYGFSDDSPISRFYTNMGLTIPNAEFTDTSRVILRGIDYGDADDACYDLAVSSGGFVRLYIVTAPTGEVFYELVIEPAEPTWPELSVYDEAYAVGLYDNILSDQTFEYGANWAQGDANSHSKFAYLWLIESPGGTSPTGKHYWESTLEGQPPSYPGISRLYGIFE